MKKPLKKFKNKYRIPSARMASWDYGSNAPYFITICTANRKHFFGEIINGNMHLNEIGRLAQEFWQDIPKYSPFITLANFVIMPNHTHGILIIDKKDGDENGDSNRHKNLDGNRNENGHSNRNENMDGNRIGNGDSNRNENMEDNGIGNGNSNRNENMDGNGIGNGIGNGDSNRNENMDDNGNGHSNRNENMDGNGIVQTLQCNVSTDHEPSWNHIKNEKIDSMGNENMDGIGIDNGDSNRNENMDGIGIDNGDSNRNENMDGNGIENGHSNRNENMDGDRIDNGDANRNENMDNNGNGIVQTLQCNVSADHEPSGNPIKNKKNDSMGNENMDGDRIDNGDSNGIVQTLQCNVSADHEPSGNPIKNEKMARISPKSGSISTIIRSYKSAVSKNARKINPDFAWQSRFHDRIIRDAIAFQNIQNYIEKNPEKWANDSLK
jgi:REP element-mobilizing transposase RayT